MDDDTCEHDTCEHDKNRKNCKICRAKPYLCGIIVSSLTISIVCFSVGFFYNNECNTATTKCDVDSICNPKRSCYESSIDDDCSWTNKTADRLLCEQQNSCRCDKTHGGLAGLVLGFVFGVICGVAFCGFIPKHVHPNLPQKRSPFHLQEIQSTTVIAVTLNRLVPSVVPEMRDWGGFPTGRGVGVPMLNHASHDLKFPWQAVFDPSSGQVYYHNLTTGVTTWDNPVVCSPRAYELDFPGGPQTATSQLNLISGVVAVGGAQVTDFDCIHSQASSLGSNHNRETSDTNGKRA